jgi:LysR family transcriptional regulator, transcriptional activator for dmlA
LKRRKVLESELEFFSKIARARTLTQAALELDYSVAAVSKRLAALERQLGVKLLRRSPRALSLTDEGEKLLLGANQILQQVERLRSEVVGRNNTPKGRLRINGTFGFGRRFLAPLIDQYARDYPEVEVQLILTDVPLDLATHAIDCCVWLDPLPEARLIARKIANSKRIVCAAPSYLKKFPAPQQPSELTKHACLILRQTDSNFATWRFTKGRTSENVRVSGHLSSNDGETVKQWTLSGQGIMVRSEWDVSLEIAQRKLVPLLTDYTTTAGDIIAWYLPGLQRTARLTQFLDRLTEQFKGPQDWRLP